MNSNPPGVQEFRDDGEGKNFLLGNSSRIGKVLIYGHRNTISIGERCRIAGQIVIKCNDGHISIGDDTTSMGIMLHMHETSRISIGRDCMFSGGIWLDTSDNHSILDLETGRRINPSKPIEIGDHVWIGRMTTILKGSTIGSDSIIGAGSVVRGTIPPNVIAAGSPAQVVREGVTWDRRRLPLEGR